MTTTSRTDPRAARVEVHTRDPWVAVPTRLMEAACGLSAEARLALIYLLGLGARPGWTIYVTQVTRALGFGNRRWPRVRRELEATGYLRSECGHSAAGDWRWIYHVYDVPHFGAGGDGAVQDTAPDPPALCVPADRGDADRVPADGGDRHRTTTHSFTSRRYTEQQQEHRARGQGRSASAAAPRSPRIMHGVTCWLESDSPLVEELASGVGAGVVLDAARACRARGEEPLPSVVARELQARARAAESVAAEQAAAEQERNQRAARAAEREERAALRDDPHTRAAAEAAIAAMRKRLRI